MIRIGFITHRNSKKIALVARLVTILLVGVLVVSSAYARKARKTHVVESGESIAKIADFYGVSQRDLREINSLRSGKSLKIGQKLIIPNVLRVSGKTYKVKKGDSLASIAAKFKRTPKEIAAANKISVNKALKVGRTLVIPDKNSQSTHIKIKGRTIKPILFLRVRTGERERLQLYYKNGKVNKQAVKRLSKLARDKHGGKVKRLNYNLINLIQRVAEEFPGKPIEIISGYRAQAGGSESQHAFGRAMDIRIPGVSGKQVFRFCRKLPRAGCGYYPKTGFVHIDAREKKSFWIDNSP